MAKSIKLNRRPRTGTPDHAVPSRLQWKASSTWKPPSPSVWINCEPWLPPFKVNGSDRAGWVASYKRWITGQPDLVQQARRELGGRHLLCFCGTEHPCHGEVLLEIANRPIEHTNEGTTS